MGKVKAVALISTCSHCGEAVRLVVSKKQLKALLKGMKASNPADADRIAEITLGLDKEGKPKF